MRIGIRRVAANTHDIYTRWGLMDPVKTIKDILDIDIKDKLDEKHRVNKELRPDVYIYSIQGTRENKQYTLEITIQEKDTDVPSMMNCKPEWCKRMLVAVKEIPASNPITATGQQNPG